MIKAVGTTDQIRRAYDLWSYVYARVAGPLEHGPRMRALELAKIQPADAVILEAAVGTGAILLEILKRAERRTFAVGIDLSFRMVCKARRLIRRRGYTNALLYQADARQLPFDNATFDVIYSSYLLDLMELKDMAQVLREFNRVLRGGGRLILVNLSKQEPEKLTWMERLYLWLPSAWVPYLLGSCRPVFTERMVKAQGFQDVKREFMRDLTHSEVVTARKPIQ